eukprot:393025-Rhodomonas_salina.1
MAVGVEGFGCGGWRGRVGWKSELEGRGQGLGGTWRTPSGLVHARIASLKYQNLGPRQTLSRQIAGEKEVGA